jgi:thymidylate synthase (FAD)
MIEATYIDHMGSDLSVVNAARVSYRKRHTEFDERRDTKLIKYLAKHKHYSPFNHTFITYHVKAPIYVARQLVKHEYMPWNEVSGRYVVFEADFYQPEQFRMSAEDKKQGSGGDAPDDLNAEFLTIFTEEQQRAITAYKKCLEMGMAEEQARSRLPLDLMTEWYWSGTLKAFHKMCSLRCKPDTQYESRLVADQISEKMAPLFPVSWAALTGDDHG